MIRREKTEESRRIRAGSEMNEVPFLDTDDVIMCCVVRTYKIH
jgi:hypothetical protein